MLLVLLSGAGLLAAGVVSLWGAVQSAEATAREEANRAAVLTAREVRRSLEEPVLLDRLQRARRFRVEAGEVVIPPWVAWTSEPREQRPEVDLPWKAVELVRRAEVAEFVDGDVARAASLLDEALAEEGVDPRGMRWLAVAAAWHAFRTGDEARLARFRDLVMGDAGASAGADAWSGAAAVSVLLDAATGRAVSDDLLLRFRTTEPAKASAVLARRAELAAADVTADQDRLATAVRETVVARDTLAKAAGLVASIPRGLGSAWLRDAGNDVLLWFPERSEGAIVPPEDLVALIQASSTPGGSVAPEGSGASRVAVAPGGSGVASALVTGNPLPDAAVPAAPFIGVLPVTTERAGTWSRPWSLIAILVVFAACLATGLVLTVRAISRESAAVRARSDFLTSVTHELKTPLSSIRLLAEMLEQERVATPEKRAEYHRLLAGEAGRLAALVENVLDLGRMERGERSYDLREARVDEVVRETVRLFAPVAARDGLHISTSLEAGTARVDAGALSQAILNVMENARKYAAGGKELSIEGTAGGSSYRILVRDRGPGVPADEREVIFERFRRGRAQADGSIPGVGLGLYLARAILHAHGGDLTCIPPPDGGPGACFVSTVSGSQREDLPEREARGADGRAHRDNPPGDRESSPGHANLCRAEHPVFGPREPTWTITGFLCFALRIARRSSSPQRSPGLSARGADPGAQILRIRA